MAHQLNLLDLPLPVLEHVLGFLAAEEEPLAFASALLACTRLRQAGEEVPLTKLLLDVTMKHLVAKEAGLADQLLAFLARKVKVWRQVLLASEPEEDLCTLLLSLAPPAGCTGVQELELEFIGSAVLMPKELSALTTLKSLRIDQDAEDGDVMPAVGFSHLSLVPGLQDLRISAVVSGQFPPATFNSLQRLTNLVLDVQQLTPLAEPEPAPRLSAEHFNACTALRRLWLRGIDVLLSERQALTAWRQLEYFSLFPANNPWEPAGFWQALPHLPALVNVQIGDATEEPVQMLHDHLPGWSRLESLALHYYPEPTLPQLPTCLTELRLLYSDTIQVAPVAPTLRSLQFCYCLALNVWPHSMTAMSQLTALEIFKCHLGVLPAPVASLPALLKLAVYSSRLAVLPQQMGCLGSLQEEPLAFASALLACTRLRQAGEAVPLTKLLIRAAIKLTEAKQAGLAGQLLAFLARKAKVWRRVLLDLLEPEEDLCPLLRSLAPPAGGTGLQELALFFVHSAVWIPKELSAFTALKALRIDQDAMDDVAPAVGFSHLSLVPRLENLAIEAAVSGQFPPAALNSLQRLTNLVLNLQQQQALTAWQQLERFALFPANNPWEPAGFWQALPHLTALIDVTIGDATEQPVQMLHDHLPGWSRLESLALNHYSEPTLPQLPTSLTEHRLWSADVMQVAAVAPTLRSLQFGACVALNVWPHSMTAMSQLTLLEISDCPLGVLPPPVAALPALVKLEIASTRLAVLPQQLACVGSLCRLVLDGNELESVPAVLAGGAASRLEHLDLSGNYSLSITAEGLQILRSLTALTYLGLRGMGSVVPLDLVDGRMRLRCQVKI
ncbi:hypothetical protein N2152v2_010051 [Parachlorella kessleri]